MSEAGQAITAAVWLAYALWLALQWMRQGLRKDRDCNAVQGQTDGKNNGQKNGVGSFSDLGERGLSYCMNSCGKCKNKIGGGQQ